MLRSSDILNKKFRKSAFGYQAKDVDAFFAMVADVYQRLCEENEILEQKINVLADKIEEYRNDESNLRGILFEAKKLGDNIISKAREQAGVILKDVSTKTEKVVGNAQGQIVKEQNKLQVLRKEVSVFTSDVVARCKAILAALSALPGSGANDESDVAKFTKLDPESIVNEFMQEREQMTQPDSDEPVTKQILYDGNGSGGVFEKRVIEVERNSDGDLVSKFGVLEFGENCQVSTEDAKQAAKKGIFSKR